MLRFGSSTRAVAVALIGLTACSSNNSPTNSISPLNAFNEANLVADAFGAATVDGNLVNPWGIAFGPTGLLWVANNRTATATVYDASGNRSSLVVSIPSTSPFGVGAPTGTVLNTTGAFSIGGGPAVFLFAGEDGSVSAWNPSAGSNAVLVINSASFGAVYKGIAIASVNGNSYLYATDFHNNRVDVFDGSFNFVTSITDPNAPANYAPFGIQNVNGQLFVTFAQQLGPDNIDDLPGVGNGFVDVFNANGVVAGRFASGGTLNAPWGVAVAPSGFGAFAGDILIGNFGDGHIGVYDGTGRFIDLLRDANNNPLVIDGLWGMTFGPGFGSTSLYFASGPSSENHGLVGTITPR